MTEPEPPASSVFWDSVEILEGQHWISHEFKGRGEMEFAGNLRISGQWTGAILSKVPGSQLHVMTGASIVGRIRVDRLSVEGDLKDIDIETDWLRIMPGAKVSGRILSAVLVVDEGAVVQGRIVARSKAGKITARKEG